MIALVEQHRPEIDQLCRRYGVRRLELFGSAASGRFDPASSDLDFLVEFAAGPSARWRDYFDLLHALEDLLGRRVDLVETRAIRNPWFLEVVNRHRDVLYDTAA